MLGWFVPLRVPRAANTTPEHIGGAVPGVTSWAVILGDALSIPPMLGREGLLIAKLISKQF